jgi:hypothetical protein
VGNQQKYIITSERMWLLMRSILIRYIDSKKVDPSSYLSGDLYLSSLSKFWKLRNESNGVTGMQDFSEGVAMQVPHNSLNKIFPAELSNCVVHDARFRMEAYGYCNLLCFFRIDAIDTTDRVYIAKDYINSARFSPLLNNKMNHVVQIPSSDMNSFGDTVIIVKDETKFIERILATIRQVGGECVIGDVRYHPLKDRLDPSSLYRRSITFIPDTPFDLKDIDDGLHDIISYGSLDKYDIYSYQREWRVCWLPDVRNNEPKFLHIGNMSDIIEIIPTSELMDSLQSIFLGYYLGDVKETRRCCAGTLSYADFKAKVESIDGKCKPIFEIG